MNCFCITLLKPGKADEWANVWVVTDETIDQLHRNLAVDGVIKVMRLVMHKRADGSRFIKDKFPVVYGREIIGEIMPVRMPSEDRSE